MVSTYSTPIRRYTVTHSATDYHIEDATENCIVTMRENAVDTATLLISDEHANLYYYKIAPDDEIKIYFDYRDRTGASDPPTNLRFDGFIDDVTPILSEDGVKLLVTARSVGRSLLMSVCGDEYGSESLHDSLTTMKTIITAATDGIVPNWVNKIPWSSDTTSGYSLGLSAAGTDYVATIAGTIKYLYFAYEPCKKALDDLMDVVQAIKGAAAGPHYIVHPTNYLCVATVGSHEAGPANLWPTWWRTNAAGSTLIQGTDFTTHNLQRQAKAANYVLYHGKFRKPVNEAWTEEGDASNLGSDLWTTDSPATWTISDDNATYIVGTTSIKVNIDDDAVAGYAQVPDSAQSWEVSKWGGKYNKTTLHFQVRKSSANPPASLSIYLMSGAESFSYELLTRINADVWTTFNLPIGPYSDEEIGADFAGWTDSGAASWADIDSIRFYSASQALQQADFWVDDLRFEGWILRGARPAAAYTSSNPAKIAVITDDVAKDDSGIASDDSGMMARLAYAELLRAKTTPIQGQVQIAGAYDLLAGQLVHIHAGRLKTGVFSINDDFRVQEHKMVFDKNGFRSILSVTDDVVNGRPQPPHDAYNVLLKAVNPDFQTRQISSIKARDIDITQTVMEKTY